MAATHVPRALLWLLPLLLLLAPRAAADEPTLRITWDKNLLTIEAAENRPPILGQKLVVNYLEAYCRDGSTDREWGQTVIKHTTRLVRADAERRVIELECKLADGVTVAHAITAEPNGIDFHLTARNPTATASRAHWAQPCIRVADFTGRTQQTYLPKCFIIMDGKPAWLPTEPWATQARYVPGQVYCPAGVPRTEVNPRPLSSIVPSRGLIGCVSADGQWVMGSAWQPYQELFQGVITCVHSDFRIGGLAPGETKQIRGKIYLARESVEQLVKRYEHDFPEHVR